MFAQRSVHTTVVGRVRRCVGIDQSVGVEARQAHAATGTPNRIESTGATNPSQKFSHRNNQPPPKRSTSVSERRDGILVQKFVRRGSWQLLLGASARRRSAWTPCGAILPGHAPHRRTWHRIFFLVFCLRRSAVPYGPCLCSVLLLAGCLFVCFNPFLRWIDPRFC